MSSWFSVDSLKKSLTDNINVESLKEMAGNVQQALPKIDQEMIEKLTLTTPELTAERQRIDAEERRKEQVRDTLAGLLPWETRDPERDILVDECRDAILQLSQRRETFFGPYPMPEPVATAVIHQGEDDGEDEDDDDDDETKAHKDKPSAESLEKLAKLEPLPVLLREFDLDSHVGLIKRLLQVDKTLVEMQSSLSGGGEREIVFWKNFFFHCAFTRYEAGLSIDEIWSDNPPVFAEAPQAATAVPESSNEVEEETITFEDVSTAESEKAFHSEPATDPDAPFSTSPNDTPSVAASAGTSEGVDFEMVADVDDSGNAQETAVEEVNLDAADYELDELEAEIARELED